MSIKNCVSWWHHQMETFSALLALCAGNSPVTGEFPSQRPVTRSFDVFFDLHLNKRLSKQSWGWWFESPSSPLWRHCNDYIKDARGPHLKVFQSIENRKLISRCINILPRWPWNVAQLRDPLPLVGTRVSKNCEWCIKKQFFFLGSRTHLILVKYKYHISFLWAVIL